MCDRLFLSNLHHLPTAISYMMESGQRDAQQAIIDENVSRLDAEVNAEIAHLLADVNAKVARLRATVGEEKSRLNRQRNNLSPVYRLPPELISRIFFASLTTSQQSKELSFVNPGARIHRQGNPELCHTDRYAFELWRDVPDTLRLCHVCQYWRSVALGFPALWSHIQVGNRTKPELLEFVKGNAKRLPITLDLQNTTGPRFKACDKLLEFFKADVDRLTSLAIYVYCGERVRTRSEPSLSLFQYLTASASRLESIQIVVPGRAIAKQIEPFPSALSNLSCLELRGVIVPWSSPILRSPLLTYLVLHDTPNLDPTTMGELISFLQQATQLESLYIDLPPQRALTWDGVGGQPESPVELPNLDTLQLTSKFFAPLSLMMQVIHIDDIMSLNLQVFCGELGNNLQSICEFTHPRIAPQQVEIGYTRNIVGVNGFVVNCDFRSFFFDQDFRECIWYPQEQPWINISAGRDFPFPELTSTRYRVPWCFSNLSVFVVGDVADYRIPQEFWEELSGLPTLEVIHMKYARITLVAKFLRSMLRVNKRRNPPQYPVSSTKEPVSHPFPRLRALAFDSLGTVARDSARDLKGAGYSVSEQWMAMSSGVFYLSFLAGQLRCWRDYGRRQLICLSLQAETGSMEEEDSDEESQVMFKAVDSDLLRRLKLIARTVVLGNTTVWDYYADREAKASKSQEEADLDPPPLIPS